MNPDHLKTNWSLRAILAIAIISITPMILIEFGLSFGSASQGGAGAHFAGWLSHGYTGRIDINALGLVLIIGALTTVFNRLRQSRLVLVLGITLVLAGLVDTIQFSPEHTQVLNSIEYQTTSLFTALLSRLGAAAILFMGSIVLTTANKPRKNILCYWLVFLGISTAAITWTLMLRESAESFLSFQTIHILTFTLYGLTCITLGRALKKLPVTILGQLTLAAFVPLSVGQIWLATSVSNTLDQGFHIAVLLKWLAWLLPTIGLSIDLTNTLHTLATNQDKLFLRSVIDAIPHYIFARDGDGIFTLVNKSVADFYDLPVDQVEGKHIQDIHADLDQCRQWVAEDREIINHGKQLELPETTTFNADGQKIWISATKKLLPPLRYSKPQVLGVSIDITPTKTAESALAERLKFEQASAAIVQAFVQTNSKNLQDTMDRILQHLGFYTEADRCFIYRFTDPNQDARLLFSWLRASKESQADLPLGLNHLSIAWMAQWFALNIPVAVDHLSDLPDSADRFMNIWNTVDDTSFLAIPIMHDNHLMGFLGVDATNKGGWEQEETNLVRYVADMFMTVWSKLEAEKSLVGAMKEAQASSKAKSEFLANMSHEIRTPMNCVIGISDLLMEMDPSDNQKQYLEMIGQSGSALLALINDILDLSKIEAGQLELDPIEMNLRSLVEEISGLTAFNTQAKGVEMISRIAPGAPDTVVCDPNRLRQVLTNLLNNAAKFTSQGHIYLNVEPTGQQGKKINLKFEISDTGIGIEKEKLNAIFEKFTQADATTTRKFGGTGLGLPISQHLVNLMGGKISADSVPGSGTTFSFTLQVEIVQEAEEALNLSEKDAQCVLVVTGHKLGGEVLAEQVRTLGHDCSVALGYDDAIKLMPGPPQSNHKKWSVILVDQDVIQSEVPRLKNYLKENNNIRLIMLTALSSNLRQKNLKLNGFSGSLSKPVRPDQLKAVLNGTVSTVPDSKANTFAQAPDPTTAKVSAKVSEETSDGPHILVAEDNPFNQRVAMGMFKLLGCQVDVANNGREAVEMVQKTDYSLVFMDCQMPEMDGYEATRVIRKLDDPQKASVTIIAMTANALSGDKRACFEVGMDDFLSKPINKAMLSEMLSKWEQVKALI